MPPYVADIQNERGQANQESKLMITESLNGPNNVDWLYNKLANKPTILVNKL